MSTPAKIWVCKATVNIFPRKLLCLIRVQFAISLPNFIHFYPQLAKLLTFKQSNPQFLLICVIKNDNLEKSTLLLMFFNNFHSVVFWPSGCPVLLILMRNWQSYSGFSGVPHAFRSANFVPAQRTETHQREKSPLGHCAKTWITLSIIYRNERNLVIRW